MKNLVKKSYIVWVAVLMSMCAFLICNKTQTTTYAVGTSAKAMCVLDAESGRVLYSKNKDIKLAMASTTKIVTAITVLDNCKDLSQVITIDDSAVGVSGTSIYLRQGEQMSVIDLLYGLMLRSGNDSAVALAVHTAGSEKEFTKLMLKTATNLGLKNSNFVNPHGLDANGHYTTAYDLAKITAYALENQTFAKIVSTKSHIIPATNKSEKRYLTNKNRLLSSLEGCCGVKTGFTDDAGRCLVSACKRNNSTRVCVVLNCGPMFEESANLLSTSFLEYKNTNIFDKDREIYNEYLVDDKNVRLYLYTNESFCYPLLDSEKQNIKIKYFLTKSKAEPNEEVGKIEIYLSNHLLKTLKLYTINKIDKLIENDIINNNELWEETLNENQQIYSDFGVD